jgi:hypothetical protein
MLGIYTIYDRKAESYLGLMTHTNDATARRSFCIEFGQKPLTPIVRYPDDYDLFCIGAYDEQSSQIRPVFPGRLVCSCRTLVQGAVDGPDEASEADGES